MRMIVGVAVGLAMLAAAGVATAQCDPFICSNPANVFQTLGRAQAHCRNDVVVWQEGNAPVYHLKGSPKFGKTPTGGFMCKAVVVRHGSRLAKTGSGQP